MRVCAMSKSREWNVRKARRDADIKCCASLLSNRIRCARQESGRHLQRAPPGISKYVLRLTFNKVSRFRAKKITLIPIDMSSYPYCYFCECMSCMRCCGPFCRNYSSKNPVNGFVLKNPISGLTYTHDLRHHGKFFNFLQKVESYFSVV